MRLRPRLLLLALGAAVVVGMMLLRRAARWSPGADGDRSAQRGGGGRLSGQPSEAEEQYVDWAIEQMNQEKKEEAATSGGAAASAATAADSSVGGVRHADAIGGNGWPPAARGGKMPTVGGNGSLPASDYGLRGETDAARCFESYTTETIKDILSGEVADAALPTAARITDGPGGGHVVQVIVVPFAHSDPGWLLTLDEYFATHTRRTLDLMVEKLQQYKDLKFVWSEAVFLHMWWQTLDESTKDIVRSLIASGKLELAHGSWVVADEAVTSLYALVENMAVGHEFVRQELDSHFVPRHGWAVDVFGYSSASARLQLEAGLEALVLLRVHAQMKSFLRRQQALEFHWQLPRDSSDSSSSHPGSPTSGDSIFCHMEPGRLYSISQSCGPEPRVCTQFDFRHIKRVDPVMNYNVTITAANVAHKAALLAEQYRLKAQQLARGSDGGTPASVVLVPLGDDFRFDYADEWDEQYANYRRLFDYFAEHPQLGIEARFGTPADYFALAGADTAAAAADTAAAAALPPIPARHTSRSARARPRLPCISGDFFPYSDEPVYGDYWTGFYSTRMWLKVRGRLLEQRFRTAQLLHAYSVLLRMHTRSADDEDEAASEEEEEEALRGAERNLALFAHHDAVTGTSKPHVAADYYTRLSAAITVADSVAASSLSSLVHRRRRSSGSSSDGSRQPPTFSAVDDAGAVPLISFGTRLPSSRLFVNVTGKPTVDIVSDDKVLNVGIDGVDITIFNPLISAVDTVVHVLIDRPRVTVSLINPHQKGVSGPPRSTSGSNGIACQVNPIFADADLCSPSSSSSATTARYQLAIEVRLAALDVIGLTLQPVLTTATTTADGQLGQSACPLAKVTSFAKDDAHASRQRACLAAAATASGGSYAFSHGDALVRLGASAIDGRFLVVSAAGRAFFSASSGLLLAFYPGCIGSNVTTAGGSGSAGVRSEPIAINMHLATYGASKSGPYIFRLPTAEQFPKALDQQPMIAAAVIKAIGPVETVVTSVCCWSSGVEQAESCVAISSRLTNIDDGVHVGITSLLTSPQQFVMRMNTSVRNEDHAFYTDSNGLGLMRRKAYASLPVSGNYYPVTAATLIEDGRRRVTLLTGQPAGVTSLTTGQLEVMLDRHTRMDDGRGVGEGASDNRLTTTVFRVLPELASKSGGGADRSAALSSAATAALLKLQNPATAFSSVAGSGSASSPFLPIASASAAQPCGGIAHLLSVRVLPERNPQRRRSGQRSVAIVIHAMHADGSVDAWLSSSECQPRAGRPLPEAGACPVQPDGIATAVNLTVLFKSRKPSHVARTTLTMMRTKGSVDEPLVSLPAGNVYTFNVTFASTLYP